MWFDSERRGGKLIGWTCSAVEEEEDEENEEEDEDNLSLNSSV